VSEPLNCDYFVSILTLSLFDSLAEGIAILFVFGHVSGNLALVKSSGSRFQVHLNAAINPRFLVWECFNLAMGTTSSMHVVMNSLTESAYSSMLLLEEVHIPVHV
jgi:hypothetical protein